MRMANRRERSQSRQAVADVPVSQPLLGQTVRDLCSESHGRAGLCFGGFLLTIFRRSGGLERMQQAGRDASDFIHGSEKRFFIRLRRLAEAADLPYKLQ